MHATVRHGPQSEVYRLEPDPHISARKDNSQQGVLEMPHGMRDAMEVGSVWGRGVQFKGEGGGSWGYQLACDIGVNLKEMRVARMFVSRHSGVKLARIPGRL